MSNLASEAVQKCDAKEAGGIIVRTILRPASKDLGGFSVRRSLPTVQQKMVGPWIFFDHMGPAEFPAGKGIDVRPHPHIGIATVTYLFEGEILHRDSLGSEQAIRPGDVNLMVAGFGIVHSEREREEALRKPRCQHGLQLWMALPEHEEERAPSFHHYPGADIPAVDVDGVAVRVMMGKAYDVESPVRLFAETLYVEAFLQQGQRLTLPDTEERAVYVVKGELSLGDTVIAEHNMAILSSDQQAVVEARKEARIAVIGGERFSSRFIEWNFVSSRKERIAKAKEDWKAGRFDNVPGDEKEFIPLPE